eukprot:gb/GFBE01074047.1/.p1 GENE.gb/GFBE01074047.1/~~gb/GFBE01074047.1/.p1  ORF type:complete len:273 (+),score=65.53 gb/GFBE01074047.1/:1-819(+)
MGGVLPCCSERKPPRTDVPAAGREHFFKVKADSVLSGDSTVFDDTPDDGGSPWLHLKHSNNLDSKGGSVILEMKEQAADKQPLLEVKVGDVIFGEMSSKFKADSKGWWDPDEDAKTKLAWEVKRTVAIESKGIKLTCDYKGVAEAKKDVDYEDRDRGGSQEREVKWKTSATTKEVKLQLTLGTEEISIQHNMGGDEGAGGYGQSYKAEGLFEVEYRSNWGLDTVHIHVLDRADPLVACAVGFILAYWMHPNRVEDDVKQRALDLLRERVSSW